MGPPAHTSPETSSSFLAHLRTLIIVWRLLPLCVSFRRDFRRWIVAGAPLERDESFHARRAAALVHALVSLGPTFVKLAQVFASRPDVVPEPYLSALGTLVDRVPVVPFEKIEQEIVTAYGRRPGSGARRPPWRPVHRHP